MVATTLVDRQIKEGGKLIQQLDQTSNPFDVAFWMLLPDSDNWRLLIGTHGVDREGTRKTYKLIQTVLKQTAIDLSLDEISVIDSQSHLCTILRQAVQTGPSLTATPFFGQFINGQQFPDAIIYRVH